jgi:hypothetical protein
MTVSVQNPTDSLSEDDNTIGQLRSEQSNRRSVLDFIKQQPLGTIGLLIIVILFFCGSICSLCRTN